MQNKHTRAPLLIFHKAHHLEDNKELPSFLHLCNLSLKQIKKNTSLTLVSHVLKLERYNHTLYGLFGSVFRLLSGVGRLFLRGFRFARLPCRLLVPRYSLF